MADKPGNPSQGKPAEAEQAEQEAAEAKATASVEAAQEKAEATEEAPQQVKKTRAKKAAKAEAAEDAPAEEKPKPARKPRAKKADKPAAEKKPAKEAAKPAPTRRGRRPAGELQVVRAHAKYVRTSARKARLVCDHIRGKSVPEARAILQHTNRAVAQDWSKLLESAVANAAENHSLDGEDLRIVFVHADEGPTLKRFRPRAMGRATKIRKRTSHLSIGLEPKE
jgi:large subunit ribosomal protein L22